MAEKLFNLTAKLSNSKTGKKTRDQKFTVVAAIRLLSAANSPWSLNEKDYKFDGKEIVKQ